MLLTVVFGIVLVNILAHEAAHYLAAKAFGYPVQRIQLGFGPVLANFSGLNEMNWSVRLFPIGGCIIYDPVPNSLKRQSIVTASGPIANLMIGAGFYEFAVLISGYDHPIFLPDIGDLGWLCLFMAFASFGFGLWNLLPVPPLDGGVLVFLAIQAVRRRALSEQRQLLLTKTGLYFQAVVAAFLLAGAALLLLRI